MSGGSYDYAYRHIDDLAEAIVESRHMKGLDKEHRELREKFAALLSACAKAAQAIEWVDSGDFGPGGEVKAIRIALGMEPVK